MRSPRRRHEEQTDAEGAQVETRYEADGRDAERREQDDQRFRSAPRKVGVLQDPRQIDRHSDEEQTRKRGRSAGLGDEEILPAARHRGHRPVFSARGASA